MDIVRNWYLVHTKPRKESVAEQNLERQGYEVYLPLIHQQRRRYERWVQIIEPLFPRYLFIRLRPGYDNMTPVRYTSGVQNLVRFTEEPAIVPGVVVDCIMRTADAHTGLHSPKRPAFQRGDSVTIEKGPLANLQAIVWGESGEERVMILLTILGRETVVTVSRNTLGLA